MFAVGLLHEHPMDEYTDSVGAYLDDRNTANKPKRALEGVERSNLVFADLVKTQQIQESAEWFMSKFVKPFLSRFDLRITPSVHVRVNTIETKPEAFERSVPNTTPRITSFEERSVDGGAVYFQQGIVGDMYALETPEGRVDWDSRFQAMISNIANAIGAAGAAAILTAYTDFARAAVFETNPAHDPATAFDRMCHYNNIVMKSEHAMTDLVAKLDALYGGGVRSLLASRETAMQIMNTDMTAYVKSGRSLLAVMNGIGEIRTVNGVTIDALPMVEPDAQNDTDKRWLRNMQMTWTIIPFVHPGKDQVRKEGARVARAMEVVDMETDDWYAYELDETIANTPWFIEEGKPQAGELDLNYLDKFAEFATEEYNDYVQGDHVRASRKPISQRPFALSGTIPVGNENALPLLMFIPRGEPVDRFNEAKKKKIENTKDYFKPVENIGNLPEEYIRTEYLFEIIDQIFTVFRDPGAFLDGMGVFDEERDKIGACKLFAEGVMSRTKNIKNLGDVVLGTLTYFDLDCSNMWLLQKSTRFDSGAVLFGRINMVYSLQKSQEWKDIAVLFLMMRISANNIRSLMYHGIDSYLGAIILRCEHRLMDSMLATQASGSDKYGIAYTPGIETSQLESGMTAAGEHKLVKLDVGAQIGFIIPNPRMFCPLNSVCGSHPVRGWGGSSSGFYPQSEAKNTGRPLYSTFIDHVDAGLSNMAALVSYNCLIENTLPASFAVCGYYTKSMFPQYLDESEEFTTSRRVPLWPGAANFMYSNPFLHREEVLRDPHRTSFRDIAQERSRSLLAGVGTCRHVSHRGEIVMTPARHMEGVVMPGSRDRLQGYAVIGAGTNSGMQENGYIRTGELVGAGGVHGGWAMRGNARAGTVY